MKIPRQKLQFAGIAFQRTDTSLVVPRVVPLLAGACTLSHGRLGVEKEVGIKGRTSSLGVEQAFCFNGEKPNWVNDHFSSGRYEEPFK